MIQSMERTLSVSDIYPIKDREEWLGNRSKGLGGTDMAAILGISPWASPLDVYLDKLGLSEPREQTSRMRLGQLMEAVVAQLYTEQTGIELQEVGFVVSHEASFMCGSPDRIATDWSRGVEIKAYLFNHDEWGEPGTDQVPRYVVVQCAWYMMLMNVDVWDVAALLGSDTRLYTIKRDRAFEAFLKAKACEFWNDNIINRVPPEPNKASDSKLMQSIFPSHDEGMIIANDNTRGLAMEIISMSAMVKATEELLELKKAALKNIIGSNKGILGDDFKATWSKNKDSIITDWEAVALEMQATEELIKKHQSTRVGARTLRVNKISGGKR